MESIFEGWTKQAKFRDKGHDGSFCAAGFIVHKFGTHPTAVLPRLQKVAEWIQANLNPPTDFKHPTMGLQHPASDFNAAIFWANNTGQLDPEGFRTVDLLCQGYVPSESPEPVESEIHQ